MWYALVILDFGTCVVHEIYQAQPSEKVYHILRKEHAIHKTDQ